MCGTVRAERTRAPGGRQFVAQQSDLRAVSARVLLRGRLVAAPEAAERTAAHAAFAAARVHEPVVVGHLSLAVAAHVHAVGDDLPDGFVRPEVRRLAAFGAAGAEARRAAQNVHALLAEQAVTVRAVHCALREFETHRTAHLLRQLLLVLTHTAVQCSMQYTVRADLQQLLYGTLL